MTIKVLEICDNCQKIIRQKIIKEFDICWCANKLSYCEECKKKLGEEYVQKKLRG